jgi:inhibitor of cysteine peptidase
MFNKHGWLTMQQPTYILIFLAAALAGLLLPGCVTEAQPEHAMILGQADNGASIMLPTGATMQVILPANPTTGYNWRISACDEKILKLVQQRFEPSTPARAGSGGQATWSFRAVAAGSADLLLEYVRSWEKTEPVQRFQATITVTQ